jgi:adenosylcobinamide kinase / adenosylcobinamide-phosphate guanylyltransferase
MSKPPTRPKNSFVLGGARSGKSRHAEGLAAQRARADGALVYVATAQIFDDEMQTRIDLHKARRGPEWRLVEAPLDLVDALHSLDKVEHPVLVDCLSIWTTNLLLAEYDMAKARERFIGYLAEAVSSHIFVASETGLGIVPDNALSRKFRDESGILNQMVAEISDEVLFVTVGIAQRIKP